MGHSPPGGEKYWVSFAYRTQGLIFDFSRGRIIDHGPSGGEKYWVSMHYKALGKNSGSACIIKLLMFSF